MISKVSIQYLIDRMQKSITSTDVPRTELESLAAEVKHIVDILNLQIKRCASWIDTGRCIEASALSSDCDNLVFLADRLSSPRVLKAWSEFCSNNALTLPATIKKEEVEMLNAAGSWGKTIDDLTSNWIESNILQYSITDRWNNLKKLEKNDEQNPVWEQQGELLSGSVLPELQSDFELSKENRDVDSMKRSLQSTKSLSLSPERKKEEIRMATDIKTVTSELASEQLAEIAEQLAEASCEGDFSKQRLLISQWRECVAKGGTCSERTSEVDTVIQALKDEDDSIQLERIQKDRLSKLEHLLDTKTPCHDIEVLYYEIKEKHLTDIPDNLEERVRYVINEEKSKRRRKTRVTFTIIFVFVAIVASLITLSVLKSNRDEKIAGYVQLGETCLANLDFDCYDSWLQEVEELHFEKIPSIQSVIAKRATAESDERRRRKDASIAFIFAESVISTNRPDISEFTTCKQQMKDIANSPLADLSNKASLLLQSLIEKEVKLITDDTTSLQKAIDIADSDINSLSDPARRKEDKIKPAAWNASADELEIIKNKLYKAMNLYRFANLGIQNRAKNKIVSIKIDIARMSGKADDLEACINALASLKSRVPQNAMEWENNIDNYLVHKTTASAMYYIPGSYWSDLKSSVLTAKAIQHWRDISYSFIESFWNGRPWIDNMGNKKDTTALKAKLEHHLQLHPKSPYKKAVEEMILIVSNQTQNDGSTIMREISAFSDIYKIELDAGAYYFGKGSNQPEDHGIDEDKDVNKNPSELVTLTSGEIGASRSIQNIPQLTKLSNALTQFINTHDLAKQSAIEQVQLALEALKICKTSNRIENPILSFAACKHIAEQLLHDRGQTLQVLAPEYYRKLHAWDADYSMKATWPKTALHSDETNRTHARSDSERSTSALPNPDLGLSELDLRWESLNSELLPASIQGILKPTKISFEIIGDLNPDAFVLIKTNDGWKFSSLLLNIDGTIAVDGTISTSPSLIFQRGKQ